MFFVCTISMVRKRGRPRKSPSNKLEERVDLRVTEVEKAAFKVAAQAANLDLSVWIRVQLHRAMTEQVLEAVPTETGTDGQPS
jgi:ribosomal protein S3